jgi:hypothetical protein
MHSSVLYRIYCVDISAGRDKFLDTAEITLGNTTQQRGVRQMG